MPKDFVEKMAKYVAFLYREEDLWDLKTGRKETVNLFGLKIEAASDICSMFNCRAEVWREAKKIYDFEEGDAV